MNSPTTFDLANSYKAIFKDPEWPLKTTIGGFINYTALGAFLFNPAFTPICFVLWALSTGYLLRTLRSTAAGDLEKLPNWGDWLDLLISGLSWLSIAAGFFFFALSTFAISLIIGASFDVAHISKPNFLLWSESTFLGVFFIAVAQNFFLTVLMANFAEEERMAAGFAWRKTLRRIAKAPVELASVWLAGSALTVMALVIPPMTLIGALFTPFCYFLAQIISTRMIGQTWAYINQIDSSPKAIAKSAL
ncbi:hypothetical protein BH11CYA1_BH11CYA1_23200 [soil metagenome]